MKAGIIFHSDGGGQYYDKNFLLLTQKYQFKNSMCEFAYQNGKSERLNGIIKNNYLKFITIENLQDLVHQVDLAVKKYNTEKPHKGLKYLTPAEFENKHLSLKQPKALPMTESLEANNQVLRGFQPLKP